MEQAKKSYLTKALYYRDTVEHMDGKETPQIAMLVKKRGTFTSAVSDLGMVGVPLSDLFKIQVTARQLRHKDKYRFRQ